MTLALAIVALCVSAYNIYCMVVDERRMTRLERETQENLRRLRELADYYAAAGTAAPTTNSSRGNP